MDSATTKVRLSASHCSRVWTYFVTLNLATSDTDLRIPPNIYAMVTWKI